MSDPFAGLSKDDVAQKLDQILEEVSEYSVDIEPDPTLPELGFRYLQRVLSQCRNYTNRVTFYLQACMRLEKALKSEIRCVELDLEMKTRSLLADDPQVRQQSSIEDRKALAGTMLKAEHTLLDELRVRLVDVEETVKILKLKHSELLRTSNDIKLQRAIVRDDKLAQLSGEVGYSKPQVNQDRSVPAGMPAPVTSDQLNPTDLLEPGAEPAQFPTPIDNVHARQIAEFLAGPDCRNGHVGVNLVLEPQTRADNAPAEPDEPMVRTVSYADLLD